MSQKYRRIKEYLIQFLREETFKTGLNGGVMALDHGLDSAVTAILAKEAFGNRLLVLISQRETENVPLKSFCEKHDIRYFMMVEDAITGCAALLEEVDSGRKEAFVSRVRMAVLYDTATRERALVLGSKNKSALLLGEGTVHGDLACALNPIGDLYRSEVAEFAAYLGIDDFSGISNVPDNAEALDSLLKAFTEERLSREELIGRGYDSEAVDTVIDRIYHNQFKHKLPLVAKLTSRTVGQNLRYPRDIKL